MRCRDDKCLQDTASLYAQAGVACGMKGMNSSSTAVLHLKCTAREHADARTATGAQTSVLSEVCDYDQHHAAAPHVL
jgi:hypothetical protein